MGTLRSRQKDKILSQIRYKLNVILSSVSEHLPRVIFCHKPPATLNEVVVSESEEVH